MGQRVNLCCSEVWYNGVSESASQPTREVVGTGWAGWRSASGTEAGITDPTFVPLGEELRAWKLVLDGRFDGVRGEGLSESANQ